MFSERKLAHAWDGNEQTILEHAYGTAALSEKFAAPFGKGKQAKMAGLLHDIGKYSSAFQQRIRNPEETAKCDHATAGALEAWRWQQLIVAMSIMGHHSGLADFGGNNVMLEGTCSTRLKRGMEGRIPDYSCWKQECGDWDFSDVEKADLRKESFATYVETKMLYSSLVDADFLDTERAATGTERRKEEKDGLKELLKRLEAYIGKKGWLLGTEGINGMRTEILQTMAEQGMHLPKGVYKLTVPTGGGKTVSSLRFALQHAVRLGMDRIIYVIPYTNIIEQTAGTFRKILGDENVLEHHSQVAFGDDEQKYDWRKLASENWDARVIVTTAVQFFESLFHNKSSHCRKLHNIANSVVIYDEIQMLPVQHWKPCVRMIQELSENYGVTQVLCTATQPAIQWENAGMPIQELTKRTGEYFQQAKRVTFSNAGELSLEKVAQRMSGKKNALCIVNTKKNAKAIFDLLPQGDDTFHLTTMMVPVHRECVLKEIRKRLDDKLPCKVVATSLVEAGVDLDFFYVMRELAGLDSILQAAGRCNRNGIERAEDSITEIFSLGSKTPLSMRQQIEACRYIMQRYEQWDSLEAIETYFLFWRSLRGDANLDVKKIMEKIQRYAFAEVAQNFHMIEEKTETIYIPWQPEGEELVEMLRKNGPSMGLMRKLGRYGVNVYQDHYRNLLELGDVELIGHIAVLNHLDLYSEDTGLAFQGKEGEAWFF